MVAYGYAWAMAHRAKLSPDEQAKFDARTMEIDARLKAGEKAIDLIREYEARIKAEREAADSNKDGAA